MHALVFADRPSDRLLPLTRKIPAALLPVAGKSLLEHTLDDLANAGIADVTIIVREHAGVFEEWLKNTSIPKPAIRLARARFAESPTEVARRIASRLPDTFLALRGDVYREPCLESFLAGAKSVLATQVTGRINGRDAQVCLCRKRDLQLDALEGAGADGADLPGWRAVEIASGLFSPVGDITEYYLANIESLVQLAGAGNQLNHPSDYQLIRDGQDATGIPGNISGPVLLGSGCAISEDARLVGPVVVGHNTGIDAGAFLHACIVLPGTYIPAGTRLQNAIVAEQMAVDINGKTICRFADRLNVSTAA
jgi:NDP-sugar pyrophosphorylase family protein